MCPMCLCVSKKNFNLTMLFFTCYLVKKWKNTEGPLFSDIDPRPNIHKWGKAKIGLENVVILVVEAIATRSRINV